MPFNLEFIKNVSSNEELITVSFNSEDLTDRNQNQIAALKAALLRFKKVKFRLEEYSSKNLFAFMRVIQNFLDNAKQLEDFDISDSGFLTQLSQSVVQLETKTEQIKFKRNQYLYNEKTDTFITALFKQTKLKKLNLSHNLWLLKEQHARRIGLASRQGMWIDLRHTHRDGESFTLDQLYLFVKPDASDSNPLGSVLVSFKELPKTLQDQLTVASDVNLVDIAEVIIQSKRKSVFDAKIAVIRESASPDKFVVIAFEPPLEHLTDEETQQLAYALKEPSCRVSRLNLPPCNLSYLTEVIKTHHSLREVNVSKLNASPEMVANLSTIIASNSKIRRIKLDYRMLLLETNFNSVIQAILSNEQSGLKSEQKCDQQHIELIDSDENLLKNPIHLLAILKNIQNCPFTLNHIQMVVDLSRLEFDCQLGLANKKMIPFPEYSDFRVIYEEEDEKIRMKPLLHWEKQTKFILTPCYDTHPKVMCHMESYLKNRLAEREQLEQECLVEKKVQATSFVLQSNSETVQAVNTLKNQVDEGNSKLKQLVDSPHVGNQIFEVTQCYEGYHSTLIRLINKLVEFKFPECDFLIDWEVFFKNDPVSYLSEQQIEFDLLATNAPIVRNFLVDLNDLGLKIAAHLWKLSLQPTHHTLKPLYFQELQKILKVICAFNLDTNPDYAYATESETNLFCDLLAKPSDFIDFKKVYQLPVDAKIITLAELQEALNSEKKSEEYKECKFYVYEQVILNKHTDPAKTVEPVQISIVDLNLVLDWIKRVEGIQTTFVNQWLNNIQIEEERLEKERLEKERLEKERLEKERLEKERLEKERLEKKTLPAGTKQETNFSFFRTDKPNGIKLLYKAFIKKKENELCIQGKPFIVPYLKRIFETHETNENETEEAINTTARIFLLAASQCHGEAEAQLLFNRFNEGGLWGSNAPWSNCRAKLCAFMEKHPKNALALVTDSFFAFYHTLPADEKEIYERVATRFYGLVDKKILFFPKTGHTGLQVDAINQYFDFGMPCKERIAAVRLLWNGVFISSLPQLNHFFEQDQDRKYYLESRAIKKPSYENSEEVCEDSIKEREKQTPHRLNTLFLRQSFDAYAACARAKVENVDFDSKIQAHLLSLSLELHHACQPWDKENSKLSTGQSIYRDAVVRFTPTTDIPHFYSDHKKHITDMLKAYSDASGKSPERSEQFAGFQNDFTKLLDKNPINYVTALEIIKNHRSLAIQKDADINKEAWFKLNRKGHSRYLTMLTKIENKLVTAWATDPRALSSFPQYIDIYSKRVDDAINAFRQVLTNENPLASVVENIAGSDMAFITLALNQLRQQLTSDQLAGHVRTLAQPLKDLLEAYQAVLNTQNEDNPENSLSDEEDVLLTGVNLTLHY